MINREFAVENNKSTSSVAERYEELLLNVEREKDDLEADLDYLKGKYGKKKKKWGFDKRKMRKLKKKHKQKKKDLKRKLLKVEERISFLKQKMAQDRQQHEVYKMFTAVNNGLERIKIGVQYQNDVLMILLKEAAPGLIRKYGNRKLLQGPVQTEIPEVQRQLLPYIKKPNNQFPDESDEPEFIIEPDKSDW